MKKNNAKNNATINNAAAKDAAPVIAASATIAAAKNAAAAINPAIAAAAEENIVRAREPKNAPAANAPAAKDAPAAEAIEAAAKNAAAAAKDAPAFAKKSAVYNVEFDPAAIEYPAVVAVREAFERVRTSKLEFAFKCYKLKKATSDESVYGVPYTVFMRNYFGMPKSTANEYAAAGALVVYEGGAGYHSKFVESAAFGDFSVKVLVLASRRMELFKKAVAAGAITPYTSLRDVDAVLKTAEDKAVDADAAAAEKAAKDAAAEEKVRAEVAAEEKAAAAKNAADARKAARTYAAADIMKYHAAVAELEKAIEGNAAAAAALQNVKDIISNMTGLK